MPTPTLSLPLDTTGAASSNKRMGEAHSIDVRTNRILRPNFGAFFTDSFKLWSVVNVNGTDTLMLLDRGLDYKCVEFLADKSAEVGQELCMAVLISRPDLGADFVIEYQALGGTDSVDVIAMAEAALSLGLNTVTVDWEDIIDKPKFFPPTPGHLHDAKDLYGMEYVTDAIDGVSEAAAVGSEPSDAVLWNYADLVRLQMEASLATARAAIQAHMDDRNNVHQVTKAQVGLSNLENRHFYRTTVDGQTVEPYASPRTTFNIIRALVLGDILVHISRKDNPHNVTAAQVQLQNVQNFDVGTADDIVAGTRTDAYVTVKVLNDAIPRKLGGMPAHILNYNDPHDVTALQVGLQNVDNFYVATDDEAVLGASAERFVTPANMTAVRTAFINTGTALPAHVARTDNPHGDTKDQLGLSLVQNYRVATYNDLVPGTASDIYVTASAYRSYRLTAYAGKLNLTSVDNAGGVAPLDAAAQLPARVLSLVPDAFLFGAKGYQSALGVWQPVLVHMCARYVQVDLSISQAVLATAKATDMVLDIYKNDQEVFGQIVFRAGQTAGQFLAANMQFTMRPGDVLSVRGSSIDYGPIEVGVQLAGTYLSTTGTVTAPFYGRMRLTPETRVNKALFGCSDFSSSSTDYTVNFSTLTATTASRTVGGSGYAAVAYGNSWVGLTKTAGAATGTETLEKWYLATDVKTSGTQAMTSQWKACGFGNQYKGVSAGGIATGTTFTSRTDSYVYATDVNAQSTALTQALARACGYGDSTYGYVRGGSYVNSDTDGTTHFNSYRYATDAVVAVSTASTLARLGAAGAGNRQVAIVSGGMTGGAYIATSQRHVFSTDTLSAGTNLTAAVGNGAAASNASQALFFGGSLNGGTNVTLNTYQFADDTVGTASVTVAQSSGWFALSNAPGWLMLG